MTCRGLGFSNQAYYAWRARPVTDRDWADAHLINAAIDVHRDDPEFGYRFIADELPARGVRAGRNRVNRLCAQQRIFSTTARNAVWPANQGRRSTTISLGASSPHRHRTCCG